MATIKVYSYDVTQGWLYQLIPGPEDRVNFSRWISSQSYPTEAEAREAAQDQLQWLGMTLQGDDLWAETLGVLV